MSPRFLKAQPHRNWVAVGVFPAALEKRDTAEERANQAIRSLTQVGLGNLRFLFERWRVTRSDNDRQERLAKSICADHSDTVFYLREFHRARIPVVEEVYDAEFTERERKQIAAAVEQLSTSVEKPRSFTKLLLLYEKDHRLLHEVFLLSLWRSRPTAFEFSAIDGWPRGLMKKLLAATKELESALAKACSKKRVRFQTAQELRDGTQVLLFHREYTASIKRDFEHEFNVHHPCGIVLFGVNEDAKRIDVRSGNPKAAEAIKSWVESHGKCELTLTRELTYSSYEPETALNAFLGAYPQDTGIEIVSASFHRSNLPAASPIAIRSLDGRSPLRSDLETLRENQTLRPHSLFDLDIIGVTFGGMTARICCELAKGGAFRLAFDNRGWDSTIQKNFETAFKKTFGLPLNQLIDPSRLALGTVGIIGHLLTVKNADAVLPYQRPVFDKFIEEQLLIASSMEARVCKTSRCLLFDVPLVSLDQDECKKCGARLRDTSVTLIERNENLVVERLADLFKQAATRELSVKEKKFEGLAYRALEKEDDMPVCVLLKDHIAEKTKVRYQRSSLPVLMVRPSTEQPYAFIGHDGVGQLSLSYLLSAMDSEETKKACLETVRIVLDRLVGEHASRIAEQARRSCHALCGQYVHYTDAEFETDVFNVLKWLFPETVRFGRPGKIEPDGFSGVPIVEGKSAYDAKLWTWTYDAKLTGSAKGYNLNIDEIRKMVNYIKAFRRLDPLLKESKSLRAHVIISNGISDKKMKNAQKFVYGQDGLPSEHREVRLVFMTQSFLVQLYRRVSERYDQFRRRAPFFSNHFVRLFEPQSGLGYRKLDFDDADGFADEILKIRDTVHPEIDSRELIESLDEV